MTQHLAPMGNNRIGMQQRTNPMTGELQHDIDDWKERYNSASRIPHSRLEKDAIAIINQLLAEREKDKAEIEKIADDNNRLRNVARAWRSSGNKSMETTQLQESLRAVPKDFDQWFDRGGGFNRRIKIGVHCHEAADRIDQLLTEREKDKAEIAQGRVDFDAVNKAVDNLIAYTNDLTSQLAAKDKLLAMAYSHALWIIGACESSPLNWHGGKTQRNAQIQAKAEELLVAIQQDTGSGGEQG